MVTQIRWLAVLPAAVVGWFLALVIGLIVHSGIESLCPRDQMDSGMCVAPWFPYASDAVSAFGAGLAAVLVITLAVLAAPAHRIVVMRTAFVAGLLAAIYMLWQTSAIVEFVVAVSCGLLTVCVMRRYLRHRGSPNHAFESGPPSATAQREH